MKAKIKNILLVIITIVIFLYFQIGLFKVFVNHLNNLETFHACNFDYITDIFVYIFINLLVTLFTIIAFKLFKSLNSE